MPNFSHSQSSTQPNTKPNPVKNPSDTAYQKKLTNLKEEIKDLENFLNTLNSQE